MPQSLHSSAAVAVGTIRRALIAAPIAVILWMAWQHRWTADDAFINFRIVKQLEHGHGMVFNAGSRVEAGTSPLWIFLVAVLDTFLPFKLEWIAAVSSIIGTTVGLSSAMAGTRRVLGRVSQTAWLVPVGALIYVALPPVWDFSTSGLEGGLSVLWIGICWFLLATSAARQSGERPQYLLSLLLGLGPLIRPDFAVISVVFLIGLISLPGRSRQTIARLAAITASLPVAYEVFRAGYYGNLVPNTAIAKEGSASSWHQGSRYLWDLLGTYRLELLIPIALVVFAGRLVPTFRGKLTPAQRVSSTAVSAGLLHGLLIVRVGGDFMHGRFLLPSLLLVLLPILVVPVESYRWIAVTAVCAWAALTAFTLRPPYSSAHRADAVALPIDAIDPITHIADERLVHLRMSGSRHPVALSSYRSHLWVRGGHYLAAAERQSGRQLYLATRSRAMLDSNPIPLASPYAKHSIVYVGGMGLYAYSTSLNTWVVDRFGLSEPISAHQQLVKRGRPGHEKDLPLSWILAAYASPDAPLPGGTSADDVRAARHALTCGEFPDLFAASQQPLSLGRFFANIGHSFGLYRFRFPPDPHLAERTLCG